MAQISNKQTDSRLNIIPPAIVLLCVGMRIDASAPARSPVPFPLSSRPILPQPHPLACSLPLSPRLYRSSMERVHTSKTAGLLERIVSLRQWRVTFTLRSHLHPRSSRAFPHAVTTVQNYSSSVLETFAKQFVAIESWSVRFRPFPTSTRALSANK